MHAAIPGHRGWVSFLARSKDLATWELSPVNPILEAGAGEGVNNAEADLFEWEGRTWLDYATGDQATWGSARVAMYDGRLRASPSPSGTHWSAGVEFSAAAASWFVTRWKNATHSAISGMLSRKS